MRRGEGPLLCPSLPHVPILSILMEFVQVVGISGRHRKQRVLICMSTVLSMFTAQLGSEIKQGSRVWPDDLSIEVATGRAARNGGNEGE